MNYFLLDYFKPKTFEADHFRTTSTTIVDPETTSRGGGSSRRKLTYVRIKDMFYMVRDPRLARWLQGLATDEQEQEIIAEAASRVLSQNAIATLPVQRLADTVALSLEEQILRDSLGFLATEQQMDMDARIRLNFLEVEKHRLQYEGSVLLDSLLESETVQRRHEELEVQATIATEQLRLGHDDTLKTKIEHSVNKWIDGTFDDLVTSLDQATHVVDTAHKVKKAIVSSDSVKQSVKLLKKWSTA
jgi:hypothetical protein